MALTCPRRRQAGPPPITAPAPYAGAASLRSRFAQIPTGGQIAVQSAAGAVIVVFALLTGLNMITPGQSVMTVAQGSVGGVLLAQCLGMPRHRLASRARDHPRAA